MQNENQAIVEQKLQKTWSHFRCLTCDHSNFLFVIVLILDCLLNLLWNFVFCVIGNDIRTEKGTKKQKHKKKGNKIRKQKKTEIKGKKIVKDETQKHKELKLKGG